MKFCADTKAEHLAIEYTEPEGNQRVKLNKQISMKFYNPPYKAQFI
jgi:hypothetical protein